MAKKPVPKVAIACQGGGSHAAFVAGILLNLLRPERRARFDLVALSGTSGGAICAALAWAGLVESGADAATQRLRNFWRDLETHDLVDSVANFWSVLIARLPVTAEVSPYLYAPVAERKLRELLKTHLDLESLPSDPKRRASPKLLIGASDVLSGERVVFPGETLIYDDLIASAAVPPLFRAVRADGRLYWDGLFTTNPPVREFTDLAQRPDEIWIVQVNPQRRETEPRTIQDITDRRNELAGNLSLAQELAFIEKINELRAEHGGIAERYKAIRIRLVELGIAGLDYPSKLDRSHGFIQSLLANGEERAEWFFDDRSVWPRPGTPSAEAVRPLRGQAESEIAT
jgi:NTE family protein